MDGIGRNGGVGNKQIIALNGNAISNGFGLFGSSDKIDERNFKVSQHFHIVKVRKQSALDEAESHIEVMRIY